MAISEVVCQAQTPTPNKLLSYGEILKPSMVKIHSLLPLCFCELVTPEANDTVLHSTLSVRYGVENWERNSKEF